MWQSKHFREYAVELVKTDKGKFILSFSLLPCVYFVTLPSR